MPIGWHRFMNQGKIVGKVDTSRCMVMRCLTCIIYSGHIGRTEHGMLVYIREWA